VNPDEQLGVTRPQEHESGPDQVTTYIGFQVSAYINVPPNMIAIELPAGRYAQFVWQGSFESEAFQSFYPSMFNWFKEQSLTPSGVNPWIEIYGSDHDWEDRSNPANRLTVLMPIGGSALQ
jgi:predicted transcriptional regulator YdeE